MNNSKKNIFEARTLQEAAMGYSYEPLKRWSAKGDNAEEALYACIQTLIVQNLNVWEKENLSPPFDIFILEDLAKKVIGKRKLEKINEKKVIGVIVESLRLVGCPRNQAINAIVEWSGIRKTTIRVCHENAKLYEPDTVYFLFVNRTIISNFLDIIRKKSFPKNTRKHPKVKIAVEKLKSITEDPALDKAFRDFLCGRRKNSYNSLQKNLLRAFPAMEKYGAFVNRE